MFTSVACFKQKNSGKHGRNGSRKFTLIELLVVVAIIGILASLLLPALKAARRKALLVKCANQERQLYTSLNLYTHDFDGELPSYAFGDQRYKNSVWRDDWAYTPRVELGWCGKLMKYGYAGKNRKMLLCPDFEYKGPTWGGSYTPYYRSLLEVPVAKWGEKIKCVGRSNYSLHRAGKISNASAETNVAIVEAVNQFHGMPDWEATVGMHGRWPVNRSKLPGDQLTATGGRVGLGTMNMTLWDGSVHSVKDWAHVNRYPWPTVSWGTMPYYWPANDRPSWDFWECFDSYFEN